MRHNLDADQRLFLQTATEFLRDTAPLTRVRDWAELPAGYDPAWWTRAAALGWTSILVPESAGGGSVSEDPIADAAGLAQVVGRELAPGPFLATNLAATLLANDEKHYDVLDELLSGQSAATWLLGVPINGCVEHAGSGVQARHSGDTWILSGSAVADAAAYASHLLVTAKAETGPMTFLVEREALGLTIEELRGLDLNNQAASVSLRDVAVSDAARIDCSSDDLARAVMIANVLQCSEVLGMLDHAFDLTMSWMRDRFAFGRPLASYQALKHRMADAKLWIESCHATVAAAVGAVGAESPDASILVSAAKVHVCKYAPFVLQECVQFHGGIALTWEHDLHLFVRRTWQTLADYGSPSEHSGLLATAAGLPNLEAS